MINIWKTKVFQKWQKKSCISDEMLAYAVEEMKQGLINADLGSSILKKRIAREGGGKSSGYRTLIATNKGDKWFFMYGFRKNERENLDAKELESFKELANYLLHLSQEELIESLEKKLIVEIKYYEK